ncbi:MAG: MFS transporter [Alphaproteobacteria bacterium]|nr:MFS transporter [Alphaproteobacteria bacterium]
MVREIYALGALLLGMSALLIGNGLFGTLTALRMSLEEFDPTMIGIIVSCHSLGFVLGCIYGQRVISSVGAIRCFTAFAALMSVSVLLMPLSVQPFTWIPLRLGFGFFSAMVFMVAESWLAGSVSSEKKGRIFSVYMVINKGCFGLGQVLLQVADPAGDRLFMLLGVLFALCLVPIALARHEAPKDIGEDRMSFRELYRSSPVGVMGAVATGLANSAIIGLSPIFVLSVGLNVAGVSTFMIIFMVGSLALQIPIGRLSDRFDRRGVLAVVAFSAGLTSIAIAFFGDAGMWLLFALAFAIGGLSAVTYPIAMAHASDHARAQSVVAIMAGLLLAFGIGASVSPFLASLAMKYLGPSGLYFYASAIYLFMAAFTLYRMSRRAAVPDADQNAFVPQPQTSQSSPVVTALDPRTAEKEGTGVGG